MRNDAEFPASLVGALTAGNLSELARFGNPLKPATSSSCKGRPPRSLLGGIQPVAMRRVIDDTVDDGCKWRCRGQV